MQQEKLTKQMISGVEESAAISIVGAHLLESEDDPVIQLVMSSLLDADRTSLSLNQIVDASDRKHLHVTAREVQAVCDYLFIHGVLAYEGSTVRIANGFLKRQARRLRR